MVRLLQREQAEALWWNLWCFLGANEKPHEQLTAMWTARRRSKSCSQVLERRVVRLAPLAVEERHSGPEAELVRSILAAPRLHGAVNLGVHGATHTRYVDTLIHRGMVIQDNARALVRGRSAGRPQGWAAPWLCPRAGPWLCGRGSRLCSTPSSSLPMPSLLPLPETRYLPAVACRSLCTYLRPQPVSSPMIIPSDSRSPSTAGPARGALYRRHC